MRKLWKAALIVGALSLLAAGVVRLGTISTPSVAQVTTPLGSPADCGPVTRIQVPTSQGLQWKQETICNSN
jgi:hypothetical protein